MEKPSSTSDTDGTIAYNTVFIDTSLDTHLAMIVSDFDTVSDLKKKILYEHPLCFPNIGGINIHALKVKRKGYFYHLSDSMFVKSAFDRVSKSWFLSVDASTVKEQRENQNSGKPNFGDLVDSLGITCSRDGVGLLSDAPDRRLLNIDDSSLPHVQRDQHAKQKPSADNGNILSLDSNNRSDIELQEKHYNKDTITHTGCKEDNSRNGINDVQLNASLEGAPETGSVMKKKRKIKKRSEDGVCNHILKEKNTSAHVSAEDASEKDTVPDNSLVTAVTVTAVTHDMEMGSKDNADEPCKISSSDINQRSGNEVLMTDVVREGTAVLGKHAECETYNSNNVVLSMKCNTSLEGASPSAAANKKWKTVKKDDNVNSSKENSFLACDSIRETLGTDVTISKCPSGDKQRGTNATFDHLSTEILKDDNLLTTVPSSGKRKRKKKSSKFLNQAVDVFPSSVQGEKRDNPEDAMGIHHRNLEREPDAAVFPGQSVQDALISEPFSISVQKNLLQEEEENNKVPCLLDVDISAKDKNGSPELAAASTAKRMRISEDHHTIEAEGDPPLTVQEANGLNKDTGVTECEKVIAHDRQKFGSYKTGRVAEGKELSHVQNSEAMPLEKCPLSGGDELDLNSEVVVTSNLFDANGNVEPGKSSKKKRKSKKSRDPVISGTERKTDSVIGISSTEPHETIHKDHSSDKSKIEESFLSPIEGKEVPKTATLNTSVVVNDKETDSVIRNVLESLKDVSKNPMNSENKNEKSRKKSKRKQSSAALPELPKEDENVSCKNVTLSSDGIREVEADASSKLTKKTKLVKKSSENKLNGLSLEHENNTEVGTSPLQYLNGNFPKSGHADEANNNMELSCESDRTIVHDNFVPNQNQHAAPHMLVDKVTKTRGADDEVKASEDKKKLDVHSNGPSLDLQNTPKLYENQRSGGKAQAVNSSGIKPQRLSSKSEGDNLKLHPKMKEAKVSGIGAKARASNKSDKLLIIEEATRPNAVDGSATHARLDKSKQTIAASNSSLESSKNILSLSKRGNRHQSHVNVGRISGNNYVGEVVNSSEHKKSLLATSGTIFKEDSNGSSDDEDGVDNSDTSTRTPSDNSLSSDYSDGDRSAQQNGSYGSKRKESGRRDITKSYSSVTLEKILRSSSRYKAAKLTASQSQQEDPESQPFEFVPDSQADQ